MILWASCITPTNDALLISLTGPLTLVSMGLVGGILYLPRIYDRIEQHCGFGAILPFCGFCVAIAHQVEEARLRGESIGKAIGAGLRLVGYVVGTGAIGCFIIGAGALIANVSVAPISVLSGSVAAAQASIPASVPASMEQLVGAVLIGGVLSTVFQAFALFTEIPVPKVLILGLFAGGLLTPVGFMGSLTSLGGAGADIMLTGFGSAVSGTTMALLAGNPLPFIIVVCVIIALTLLGSIWGVSRAYLTKRSA
jgi:hypothetical protein